MANKNICTVDTLGSATENTNVIAEENGTLVRLNLKTEFDARSEIAYINFQCNDATSENDFFKKMGKLVYESNGNAFLVHAVYQGVDYYDGFILKYGTASVHGIMITGNNFTKKHFKYSYNNDTLTSETF